MLTHGCGLVYLRRVGWAQGSGGYHQPTATNGGTTASQNNDSPPSATSQLGNEALNMCARGGSAVQEQFARPLQKRTHRRNRTHACPKVSKHPSSTTGLRTEGAGGGGEILDPICMLRSKVVQTSLYVMLPVTPRHGSIIGWNKPCIQQTARKMWHTFPRLKPALLLL